MISCVQKDLVIVLVRGKLYAQSNNIPRAITLAQLKLNSRISKGSMVKAGVPDAFIGLSGKGNELLRKLGTARSSQAQLERKPVCEVEV